MDLIYKRATLEDINTLVETRIEVLRAANKLCADTDMGEVERQSYLCLLYTSPSPRDTR